MVVLSLIALVVAGACAAVVLKARAPRERGGRAARLPSATVARRLRRTTAWGAVAGVAAAGLLAVGIAAGSPAKQRRASASTSSTSKDGLAAPQSAPSRPSSGSASSGSVAGSGGS